MNAEAQASLWCDRVWGEREGHFLFAFGIGGHFNGSGKYEFERWHERPGRWPDDRDRFLDEALERAAEEDVYVAPYLRSLPNRKKGTALPSSILYADLDELPERLEGFERLLIGPNGLLVASGQGRHVYLCLPSELEPTELERWNRRLAHRLDADAGWSETKVLRLPGTWNHKGRARGGDSLPVSLLNGERAEKDWTTEELAAFLPELPEPSALMAEVEPVMPETVPAHLLARLDEEPGDDRSQQAYSFVRACLDSGLSEGETLALALEHRPTREKYGERARREIERMLEKPRPSPVDELSTQLDGPVFVDFREIEAQDIEWIDRPFLPEGELVTNNADGDTGKGLQSVHWGARISRGEFGDPRWVIYAVAEDTYETVVKPRLLAAGANLAYVRGLDWYRSGTKDALLIPDDVPLLEQRLRQEYGTDVRLLVIDPLLSHVSAKTNSHVGHDVRLALKPLMTLAHNLGCTVLGNGNFSKDRSGGARRASAGSEAFSNVPRVGLAMAYDDEEPDVRVLEVVKSNIGPKGIGRNYRVQAVDVEGLKEPVPMLVAEGAATKAVDDLINTQQNGKRIPSELVRELILAELENGEQPRKHLDGIASEKLGAKPDTVYKSGLEPLRKAGRIVPRKDEMTGGWYWSLSLEEQLG